MRTEKKNFFDFRNRTFHFRGNKMVTTDGTLTDLTNIYHFGFELFLPKTVLIPDPVVVSTAAIFNVIKRAGGTNYLAANNGLSTE